MAYFLDRAYVSALLVTASTLPSRLVKNLLIFTSTCTVAVFWEFGEFLLSWALSANFQGDLPDTMKDLFFGMTGSVFYIAAARVSIQLTPRMLAWYQFNRVTIEPESE
jgi:hypothetical protein